MAGPRPSPGGSRDEELRAALLAYLSEHPQAMETLEGIAQWWIPRHQVRVELESLARVLRHLAEVGVIEELRVGQDRLYRLKATEARA